MTDEPAVFVVDDDPSVRRSVVRLLETAGLRVAGFGSAESFLEHERPDGPACLVLDVRMSGMNGLELQRRLIAAGRPMAIVFITGHGEVPMSVEAMKAGAVDFLLKPFDDEALLADDRPRDRPRSGSAPRASGAGGVCAPGMTASRRDSSRCSHGSRPGC